MNLGEQGDKRMYQWLSTFLRTLFCEMSIGLIYRISGAVLAAVIIQSFILSPAICERYDRFPLGVVFFASGLLISLYAAFLVAMGDDTEDRTTPITLTSASIAAGCFFALSLQQQQLVDRWVIGGIGGMLAFAVAGALYGLSFKRWWGRPLLHLGCFVAMMAFAVFEYGSQTLTLERESDGVAATLRIARWGDTRIVEVRALDRINAANAARLSNHYGDYGDGTVLVQAETSRELFVAKEENWTSDISEFIDSADETIELRAATSSVLRFFGYWAAGAIVLMLGFTSKQPVVDHTRRIPAYTSWATAHVVIVVMAAVAVFISGIWSFKSEQRHAAEAITALGCMVEQDYSFIVNEDHLITADRIVVVDPTFDDSRMPKLVDEAKKLNGCLLQFENTRITDEGVRLLAELESVYFLNLRNTSVSADALPIIRQLHVWALDIRGTSIQASDLNESDLEATSHLWFSDAEFNRRSFNHLVPLKRLKYVYIDTNQLSNQDLEFWEGDLDFDVETPTRRDQAEVDSIDSY